MEEVEFKVDKTSFEVEEGICPACGKEMTKVIENKSLFDGALSFHLIKFRCNLSGKEFLDLNQAKKYDLFLLLNKISSKKKLKDLTQNVRSIA